MGNHIEIRRFEDHYADQPGYFVVNHDLHNMIINGVTIKNQRIVGPLPDFAWISIGARAMFWLRTMTAMEYEPNAGRIEVTERNKQRQFIQVPEMWGEFHKVLDKGKRRPAFALYRQLDHLAPNAVFWGAIYHQRMTRHRQSRRHVAVPVSQIRGQREGMLNLDVQDVVIGIAPVWEALRRRGDHFAFGETQEFDPAFAEIGDASYVRPGIAGQRRKFIMPLILVAPNAIENALFGDDDGGYYCDNHYILAVAEVTDDEETHRIDVTTYDSFPGCMGAEHGAMIRARAIEVIGTSQWLASSSDRIAGQPGPEADYDYRFIEQHVPHQTDFAGMDNTCGLFVILNAWAVMLGIPIARAPHRRPPQKDFVATALEILNLAIAGCMDARTIQAFLNLQHYAEQQDRVHAVEEMAMVRMDAGRLRIAVRQARVVEHLSADLVMGVAEDRVQDLLRRFGNRFVTEPVVRDVLLDAELFGGDVEALLRNRAAGSPHDVQRPA